MKVHQFTYDWETWWEKGRISDDMKGVGFTEPIQAVCREKKIEYKGCFDCQGALTESLHEAVKKKLNFFDEAWEGMVKQMTGHSAPNSSS